MIAVQTRLGMLPPVAWAEEDFLVPKIALVYAPTTWETSGETPEYRLAYRVEIITVEPYSSSIVHVDARTSEVFRIESALQFCSAGTASTLYNGFQGIQTKYHNFPGVRYNLLDDCRGDGIRTRVDDRDTEANTFRYFRKCDEVWDGDNQWLGQENQPVTSLHWAAEMYFDYLQTQHGRNSLDNSGIGIKLVYHRYLLPVIANHQTGQIGYYNPPANGYWDRVIDEGHFGSADGVRPMVSLDFVGHELTHGMIAHEMQDLLTGNNEALSLNESFADILGNCSETRALLAYDPSHLPNLTIFEDVFGGPYRSFVDPTVFGHPRAYHGSGWDFSGSPDLQANGAVQNYWFFLLSNGSAGRVTEANVTVCGIGSQNAARIVYRSITDFLGVASTFADARQASIQAAEALFGTGSFEATQCTNAWEAVGVGTGGNYCMPAQMGDEAKGLVYRWSVSPNPADSYFNTHIQLAQKASGCQIALWDMSGRKVSGLPVQSILLAGEHHLLFDCSDLPCGNYHLVFSTHQVHICKRVVITHPI